MQSWTYLEVDSSHIFDFLAVFPIAVKFIIGEPSKILCFGQGNKYPYPRGGMRSVQPNSYLLTNNGMGWGGGERMSRGGRELINSSANFSSYSTFRDHAIFRLLHDLQSLTHP